MAGTDASAAALRACPERGFGRYERRQGGMHGIGAMGFAGVRGPIGVYVDGETLGCAAARVMGLWWVGLWERDVEAAGCDGCGGWRAPPWSLLHQGVWMPNREGLMKAVLCRGWLRPACDAAWWRSQHPGVVMVGLCSYRCSYRTCHGCHGYSSSVCARVGRRARPGPVSRDDEQHGNAVRLSGMRCRREGGHLEAAALAPARLFVSAGYLWVRAGLSGLLGGLGPGVGRVAVTVAALAMH